MKSIALHIVIICLISILSSLIISGFSYWMLKKQAITEARIRGNILLDTVNAYSIFFERNQKPLVNTLLGHNNTRFYPELTNGFMLLRESTNSLKKKKGAPWLHLASLNPLNQENMADADESRIIEEFRAKPMLTKKDGLLNKKGKLFYYSSSPIRVTDAGCLQCHGKPEAAPRMQVTLYGMNNGYNWQPGKTVSAAIVYVPLRQAIDAAENFAAILFFISLGCFFLTFLVIFLMVDRRDI